jgi:hypothetical protein
MNSGADANAPRDTLYFTYDFAQRKGDQELSISQLLRTFCCDSVRVKPALANRLEEPKVRGRHLAIDKDSEGEILE